METTEILCGPKLLGYKNIKITLHCTQLLALQQKEECICKTAKAVEGAARLIEVGFHYATDVGDKKLFRKLKASYLGS